MQFLNKFKIVSNSFKNEAKLGKHNFINSSSVTVIFGANGFLGSSIVRKLYEKEKNCIAVVRPKSNLERLRNIPRSLINVSDERDWHQIIESYLPTSVVCANWSGVKDSSRLDWKIQQENINVIQKLAQAAKINNIKTFIAFGSQAESKKSETILREKPYFTGTSAYAKIKSLLYKELYDIFLDSHTRFVWARIFSVYGSEDNEGTLFSTLKGKTNSQIQSMIKNPNLRWSFLFESDFAEAIEFVIESDAVNGVINVANPNLISIGDAVNTWLRERDRKSLKWPKDTEKIFYNPKVDKLLDLGWKPKVNLEEGIHIIHSDKIEAMGLNSTEN